MAAIGADPIDVMVFASEPSPPGDEPAGRRVVINTDGSSIGRTGDDFVDLTEIDGWRRLSEGERRRLVATLVIQLQPAAAHLVDSPEFAAALGLHEQALRASTTIHPPAAPM